MEEKENKFMDLAKDIATLVDRKDKVYGSAFEISGDIIAILYPNGVKPEQYNNLLTMVRMIDKMVRLANTNGEDPMGESPYFDLMGYSLLGLYYSNKSKSNIDCTMDESFE